MQTFILLFVSFFFFSFQLQENNSAWQIKGLDATGKLSISALKKLQDIRFTVEGEELRLVRCTVVRILPSGEAEEISLGSTNLAQQQAWQRLLQRLKPGDSFSFEDLRAVGKDGQSLMLGRRSYTLR